MGSSESGVGSLESGVGKWGDKGEKAVRMDWVLGVEKSVHVAKNGDPMGKIS